MASHITSLKFTFYLFSRNLCSLKCPHRSALFVLHVTCLGWSHFTIATRYHAFCTCMSTPVCMTFHHLYHNLLVLTLLSVLMSQHSCFVAQSQSVSRDSYTRLCSYTVALFCPASLMQSRLKASSGRSVATSVHMLSYIALPLYQTRIGLKEW